MRRVMYAAQWSALPMADASGFTVKAVAACFGLVVLSLFLRFFWRFEWSFNGG